MKDEIFSNGEFSSGSFRFNDQVASVFDDMANRSIPFYQEVIRLISEAALRFVPEKGHIYDLGCSTGNTLIQISRVLHGRGVSLKGYDPAVAMLKKATEKASTFTFSQDIVFSEGICKDADTSNADMILLNYTLQFINQAERPEMVKKLCDSINPGGVLILSEKLRQEDKAIETFNTEVYEKFKAGNGYSHLEIANKRQALENILVPRSLEDNRQLLLDAGFSRVEILFKWLNFTTLIAFR
jgi:tRNA (cmo5U34)-methyltransferase